MINTTKAILLTIDQIDQNDRCFDVFETEPEGYHFSESLLVQKTGNGYRIITGFASLSAGISPDYRFSAVSLSADENPLEILKTIILLKQKSRALYPIEMARIFRLARELDVPETDIDKNLMPVLRLKQEKGLAGHYLQLLMLSEKYCKYLIGKKAPAKTWLGLTRFDKTGRQQIEKIIDLNPTLSVFEEIIVNLFEIAARETVSVSDLLADLNWDAALNDGTLEAKDRLFKIRDLITRRRYPLLSAHRERIGELVKQLKLPENASLNYDKTFEKKELRISWRLNSAADIKRMRTFYSGKIIRLFQQLLDAL